MRPVMETRTVRWRGSTTTVPALPTGIPGLSYAGPCDDTDEWTISHDRSGLAIVNHESVEMLALGLQCLTGIDWTRSGPELRADAAAVAAWYEAREVVGDLKVYGRAADASDLDTPQ